MTPRAHVFTTKPSDTGVAAHRLAFYDWGNLDDMAPIVCVHGLTRNARDFDVLAAALAARGRRVIAISMAGRGESQWLDDPMAYNYATYVADCIAILDNFHFRQVDWIGTSMGGIIGMTIASLQPERIRKLLLNDIGATLKKQALERIFANVRAMPAQFATRDDAEKYLRKAYATFGLTEDEWPAFIDISLEQVSLPPLAGGDGGGNAASPGFPHPTSPANGGGAYRLACDPRIVEPLARDTKNFTDIADISLAEIWKRVTCPTLILRGSQSDILDAETVSAMRAVHLETDCITIDGVGHAPALMSPAQIAIVERWLAGSPRAAIRTAGL